MISMISKGICLFGAALMLAAQSTSAFAGVSSKSSEMRHAPGPDSINGNLDPARLVVHVICDDGKGKIFDEFNFFVDGYKSNQRVVSLMTDDIYHYETSTTGRKNYLYLQKSQGENIVRLKFWTLGTSAIPIQGAKFNSFFKRMRSTANGGLNDGEILELGVCRSV